MLRTSLTRLAFWVTLLLAVTCELGLASAQTDLRIEAQPAFTNTQVTSTPLGFQIAGLLVDDSRHPLGHVPIVARAVAGSGAHTKIFPCIKANSGTSSQSPFPSLSTTEADGRYCLTINREQDSVAQRPSSIELKFVGDIYRRPAKLSVPLIATSVAVRLQFDGPTVELNVGEPEQVISVAITPFNLPTNSASATVEVELIANGTSTILHRASYQASESALSISVPLDLLGPPGPGRLQARLAGKNTVWGAAEAVVMRVVDVKLTQLSTNWEQDHVSITVGATTPFPRHIPPGLVQATLGSEALGESPLISGVASLHLSLSRDQVRALPTEPLTLNYVPTEPWWRAPPALRLTGPASERNTAQWLWLLLLAALVLLVLPSRKQLSSLEKKSLYTSAENSRELTVRSSFVTAPASETQFPDPGISGWRGIIVDAHDGRAIANAQLAVRVPSFHTPAIQLRTKSDNHGQFNLPASGHHFPEGACLEIDAPFHSPLRREVPGFGSLTLTLTSRRRTLLARLLQWGDTNLAGQGPEATESTPTHILQIVRHTFSPSTAAWAHRMRASIYGSQAVDASIETSLLAAEPSLASQRTSSTAPLEEVNRTTSRKR